jgi:8-oxo-dGTP pyrophosphatase MutT (NUDIX family)
MFEIPEERLPPGFAETVNEPPADPVEARPAATVILLRDGDHGTETLLMRRHGRSGFVPGAWVFPGGRVDPADGDPGLADRCRGLAPEPVPGPSFWMAAVREAFEETGVLLARTGAASGTPGRWMPDAVSDPEVEAVRRTLMDDAATLGDVVARLDAVIDVRPMVHVAHWVTPVVEARRYDTHFFAAVIPEGREARPDPREMVDAAWLAPAAALERFEAGDLPMVFPTVKTLEALAGFGSAAGVLDDFRGRTVGRILPRLVRTDAGVGIVIDD